MKYNLLLKGGKIVDAAAGLDGRMDVGVCGEFIAEVAPDLNPAEARRVMDISGLIVAPGLIDLHAHAFIAAGHLGLETDITCRSTGVTTLVDAGSCGAATFQGFKEILMDRAETRLRAFLHISSTGLADLTVGESIHLNFHDPERAAETAVDHSELILGIKVRQQIEAVGDNGLEPLRLAKRAASLAGGLPTMVHVTHPPVPLSRMLDLLEPGDIVTHFLHGRGMGILDDDGKISDPVKEARRRGIVLDVGHGRNHLNFPVARVALGEGLLPDTISSDLTRYGREGVVKNLLHVLSKFLNLGMGLAPVLACATANPAHLLGMEGKIGTLRKGAVADIAVLALESGDFVFEDCDGNTMQGKYRLAPRYTIRQGKLTWQWK
ncbi:MAG: amidohydrolase/deacetylase family metallohydrolase [Deltaproteobacteria bacterium]|nr:amidohydrolase/deacetylase family metallohydrolase [Deltaproteobacteria bacterium]MBW2306644.1 amidohydrolase/deacetylase family metallohydrolase [Deltaproteobacteria bacterium]